MLRWLTAGESHGPALVGDPRGPAGRCGGHHGGHRRRAGAAPARLRPRRPDEVRAGRGRASSAASGTGARLGAPGRDPGRQHRVAEVGAGHGRRPGRPGGARRAWPATRRSPGRGPATPTSSGCRSTASTTPARSWSGPAPARRRPGSRSVPSPGPSSRQVAGRRAWSATWSRIGAVERARGLGARRRRRRSGSTTTRCAASTRRPAPRWWPRSTRRGRTATRSAASSRSSSTACRRASAATCTGTAGSTPGWPAP